MMKFKNLFRIALAAALLATLFCQSEAVAAPTGDFTVENGVLTHYTGPGGDVVIPDDLGIREIGQGAFLGFSMHGSAANTTITSIVLPDGVTVIDTQAFSGCVAVRSVTLPDTVTDIGTGAFMGCARMTSVSIPKGVTVISGDTFSGCTGLTSAELPKGLTEIASGAFSGCAALSSLAMPDRIQSLGDFAFYNCGSLKSMTLPAGLMSLGTAVFAGSGISAPLLSLDGTILNYVPQSVDSYTIPATVNSLHGGAFYGCAKLSEILIPEAVTSMGNSVFQACTGLKSVTIPDSVTSIGDNTFEGCTALKSVSIPDSVTRIGLSALAGCESLTSITLPSGLTNLSESMLQSCTDLKSVTLPAGLRTIGASVFSSCTALQSLDIPVGVVTIGPFAFSDCPALKTVTIPGTVVSIGDNAFFAVYWAPNKTTIRGVPGSYAEAYATQYAKHFVATSTAAIAPNKSTVTVDGKPVAMEAYTIAGYNYFKLRDLAMALGGTTKQFDVSWDAATNAVAITTGKAYAPVGGELTFSKDLKGYSAALPPSTVTIDGREISVTVYNVGGFNYFKLRDIGVALDFGVAWDGAANTVGIITSKSYTEVN